MPKKIFKTTPSEYYQIFVSHLKYIIIIVGVVVFHLVEVNILDSYFTNLVGIDFASNIQMIENGVVYWFSQNWTLSLVYFFVLMYIVVYPFTLWFSPLYFLFTDDKKAMKSFAYGLLLMYSIALPFYLFFPVTNVYTFYGIESALETVVPNVEQFFYSTTTYNNCFPSLHVAMTLLIAKSVSFTKNKKYTYFAYFCAISVILSVIYLAIHWITDVICGVILAFSVFYLQKRFIKEE
ncbi:MAG: inositol phosphorylceramide synthase [Thermoplasmatales archaeon]|nr:inositol phosphorylceramide synthase [Thermoplasmatales archaeon]MCK5261676.1 inositol phosphorylceramide synthase [Thermoplasmatales archaeon]